MLTGDCHPVDDGVSQAGQVTDDRLHLLRGDVLAPPPVRVARPVLEVEEAELVHHEDVACDAARQSHLLSMNQLKPKLIEGWRWLEFLSMPSW